MTNGVTPVMIRRNVTSIPKRTILANTVRFAVKRSEQVRVILASDLRLIPNVPNAAKALKPKLVIHIKIFLKSILRVLYGSRDIDNVL